MASTTTNSGFDLAMEIVQTFPPKYWRKQNYEKKHYISIDVPDHSYEFTSISEEIEDAQREMPFYDEINSLVRIQNPFTYARFMLQKNQLNKMYDKVYQFRKFKIINKADVDAALKYNCDSRRYSCDSGDKFYSTVPNIPKGKALLVVQVLSTDQEDEYEEIECENDSDLYIEYVIYF